mgnify:CR=1 FL=1
MHKVFYCCCQSIFNVQSIFWGLRLVSGLFKISYLHSYDSWGQSLKYFILIVHKSCLIFWWQLPTCQLHPLIILFLLNLRIMGERWLLSSDFWRLPYGDRRVSDWEACLVGQQVFRGRALGGGLMLASEGLRSTGAGVAYLELTFGAKLISGSSWGRRGSFSFSAVSTPPLVVAISRMTEALYGLQMP